MRSSEIESAPVRYALNFLALLVVVVGGIALAMVLPESIPNSDLVGQGLIALSAATAFT